MAAFLSNAFVPTFDEALLWPIRDNIARCAARLKFSAFSFAPGRRAAEVFLQHIDH